MRACLCVCVCVCVCDKIKLMTCLVFPDTAVEVARWGGGGGGGGCARELYVARARGYKTFFMLNSIEHDIFPAHKC